MNDRRDSLPAKSRRLGFVAAGALVLTALAGHAAMANDTPGNNGTVKIHEGATEPASEVRNEPHVCTFHLHFFFSDPEQAGTWEIQEWAPGDKGTVVLEGDYDTAGDGEDRQPEEGAYGLPDGHYKLFWDGDLDTQKHDKMKVFWVDCEEQGVQPPPTEETQPTPRETQPTKTQPTETQPTETQPTETQPNETQPTETQPNATGSVLPIGGTTGSTPGSDLAAGGGGSVTPPPTDTADVEQAQTEASWPIVLLIIATIMVTASFVTPARRNR